MRYDPNLAERLSTFRTTTFTADVFRVTREAAEPTAPSYSGGRWARPQNGDPGTAILYTSLTPEGALAEVCSFLASLTPLPGPRRLKLTRLAVGTSKTVRIIKGNLEELGVDLARYGERDYARTQEIGSTLAWLGIDGLLAPSARWDCENLMIFTDNHLIGERLEPLESSLVEWRGWAEEHGIIEKA